MFILIAVVGAVAAFYFLVIRARNGAEVASEVFHMASDAAAAARRFGFRCRTNLHPVESIDDPNLAIAAKAA